MQEELVNIEGNRGDSLFYRPLLHVVNQEIMDTIQKKLDSLSIYKQAKDDRALVIIGALIVEQGLDNFLSQWIPEYKKMEFSFSRKIALMSALRLIPNKICATLTCLNEMRNCFAHKLEIKCFQDIDSERHIKQLKKNVQSFICKPMGDKAVREIFWEAIWCIMLAFEIYGIHVGKLKKEINNNDVLVAIMKI